jgi:hypothetical protein
VKLGLPEQKGTRLVGYVPVEGRGGGMQLLRHGHYVYMGHLAPGGGTSIIDVRDPKNPRVAGGLPGCPGAFSPKVQIGDGLLLVNFEQRTVPTERHGLGIYDLSDPLRPAEIGFLATGGRGVHRMWYTGGRYAYLSAVPEGFRDRMLLIADLSDPRRPEVVGRWWVPGLWAAGGEEPPDAPPGLHYNLHHAVVHGDRAYLGCWDLGVVILDVSDPARPRQVGHVGGWAPELGGHTHTALPLPGRGLLATTDEATAEDGNETTKYVRVFDLSSEERPVELARCPVPQGDFGGGRFGPHNLHENRPGSLVSEDLLFVSYFSGGLRVYDIRDPRRPVDVASYVPDAPPGHASCQINDLFVDAEGLIYLSDRYYGCLHVVERV